MVLFSRLVKSTALLIALVAITMVFLVRVTVTAQTSLDAEQPIRSEDFVNSVGVDTHFDQNPYVGSNYPTVVTLLQNLGVKHIRESTVVNPEYVARLNVLATYGIHTTIVTSLRDTDDLLKTYPSRISASFEAYEGPNESNSSHEIDWAPKLRSFMMRLYDDAKQTPSLAHFPVLAPSLIGGLNAANQLGSLDSFSDFGNMHDYYGSRSPGTPGWGRLTLAGVYGSLQYNLYLARIVSPTKPVIATETGYGSTPTGGGGNTIDNQTAGKYLPRLLFVQYAGGVKRTFLYELLDTDDSGRLYTNYGLVDTSMHPKPAYLVIKALLAEMNDLSTAFTTRPLRLQIDSTASSLRHMVFEKSDGSYELALWNEVESWRNGRSRPEAPVDVKLRLESEPFTMSALTFDPTGYSQIVKIAPGSTGEFNLKISDQITLVHIPSRN